MINRLMVRLRPLALAASAMVAALGAGTTVMAPRILWGQERGAAALAELRAGLGVHTRVLLIAAHPDDEDTPIIA